MKKMFLDDLPKINKRIDWINSIGYKVNFIYNDYNGEVEILKYNKDTNTICIKYNKKLFYFFVGHFRNCLIGKMFYTYVIENSNLMTEWNYSKNNILNYYPDKITIGSTKKVWWICNYGHEWFTGVNNRSNSNCPYCYGRFPIIGINDLNTTHPHLIKYFKNKSLATTTTKNTHKKAIMICPDCGYENNIPIYYLAKNGFSCNICGDKLSYSEKFLYMLLIQCNINFIREYSKAQSNWIKDNKRYDFYFECNNKKYIIETNGMQHYKYGFETCGGRTLEEEKENDRIKRELALSNGIDEYIELDCRKSELEWIKNSIMNSNLPYILNFKEETIDWIECNEKAIKNFIKIVCEFYETNKYIKTNKQIAYEMKISNTTLYKYVKHGELLGWCERNTSKVKVICLNYNKIFESIVEAKKWCLHGSKIGACCQHKCNYAGIHPYTSEKLQWMYLKEYESLGNDYKHKLINLKGGVI